MKLSFRTIIIDPPDLPGARALGIRDWAAPAPGRMQDEIVPSGLIMSTLRALMRDPDADVPDARWFEKVACDPLAVRDLLNAAARPPLCLRWEEEGARPVADGRIPIWSSGTWRSMNGLAGERVVPVFQAQRWLGRLCVRAVRGDLDRHKEAPGDALKRIFHACAVENARRERLIERALLARTTWLLPMAACWMEERDMLRVHKCMEDLDGESSTPTQTTLRPCGALLMECRQCPGLLLGRRSGVDDELKAIDTRFIESAQFRLNEATVLGVCWVDVCVDVGRLMAVAPAPAASLLETVVGALFPYSRINQDKSSWLAEKMGGAMGTLTGEQARDLATQWLRGHGQWASASDVKAEVKRMQSLARSFRRWTPAKRKAKR